jgi:hypothetical protein
MNEKRTRYRKREPHWDVNEDTGRVTACYRVADPEGWAVVIGLESYNGAVEVVEESLVYVGDRRRDRVKRFGRWRVEVVDPLEEVAELRSDAMPRLPVPSPDRRMTEQRRRAIKTGTYVADARSRLHDDSELVVMLTWPGWASETVVTDPRQMTDRDFALRAADFVRIGGDLTALAALRHVNYTTAKRWVETARDRGLLTRPGKGRRGASTLTSDAAQLLESDVELLEEGEQ